ncbi:MAG TPA: SGNH/GDSL hydrolase family protein [Chthoniobacterales bacterium]|jgi:hypothetical protein|nr:SGNH/GDSL hydrolase family protein [Chthoniobacterales bacterium]
MMPLQVEPTIQSPAISWQKKVVFTLILWVFLMFCLACAGEIFLRVMPMGKFSSSPFREYDPNIGIALIPNKTVHHNKDCFQGLVETNSFGMRDRERTLAKPPGTFRIAMLGDSVVEGVHVQPDEVVNIQLEKILRAHGYNAEVLNFGVEGIGTTQELLMYEKKVRQFHPDLVLLTFTSNDVMNNSSIIQPEVYGIQTWYAPYYNLGSGGNLVFQPVQTRWFNGPRTWLENHSLLLYYLERIWFSIDYSPTKWNGIPVFYGSYGDPLSPDWSKAWQVTDKVMALTKNTVEADGAKFMAVTWADFWEVDPDWRPRLEKQIRAKLPPEFVPQKEHERLEQIYQKNGVTYDFLTTYMQNYRDANHLQWPYFSLVCNPHFSALGHTVAAEGIFEKLQQHGMLPPQPGTASVATTH